MPSRTYVVEAIGKNRTRCSKELTHYRDAKLLATLWNFRYPVVKIIRYREEIAWSNL